MRGTHIASDPSVFFQVKKKWELARLLEQKKLLMESTSEEDEPRDRETKHLSMRKSRGKLAKEKHERRYEQIFRMAQQSRLYLTELE